jgi:hypothetical protein
MVATASGTAPRIERHAGRPGPLVEQLGARRIWSPGADLSSGGDGGPGLLTSTQHVHRSVSLKAGNGEPFMSRLR